MSKDAEDGNKKAKGQIALLLFAVALGLVVIAIRAWHQADIDAIFGTPDHGTAELELAGAGFAFLCGIILLAGA